MTIGRIFWKLFAAIYISIVLALASAGALISLSGQSFESVYAKIKAGFMIETAELLIARGKLETAESLIVDWNKSSIPPHLTVLDTKGKSLTSALFSTAGAQRSVILSDKTTVVVASDTNAYFSDRDIRPPLEFPLLTGALFGALLSAFLAWHFTQPLSHLRWALKEISVGNFTTRVSNLMGKRRDEITDVAHDIDIMATHLQQLVVSKQRLLHDISHELRSPLARMQVAIGLLRQNPARSADMLDRLDNETERLNDLIGQILTLARLNSDIAIETHETVDVIELITSIADDTAFEAAAMHREVKLTATGSFVSKVDSETLCRAFENVIRNAVKHTEPYTCVDIFADVSPDGRSLFITIDDHGPGLSEEVLPKAFEPFWRGESEPTSIGFGLGLAIARRAIEAHKGNIKAENIPNAGLRVKIQIPINK